MPATEDCRQLAGSDWRKSGIRVRYAVARVTSNQTNLSLKFLHHCVRRPWHEAATLRKNIKEQRKV